MARPLAIDLFCGAGGVAMGLHRAGFEVVGVDHRPQPRYPFTFVHGDALAPPLDMSEATFIWASPPCQAYSSSTVWERRKGKEYPDLVKQTRALLASLSALTCMENVIGAPLRPDLVLDGTMFPELRVVRRRIFELNWFCWQPSSRIVPGLVARHGYSCVVGGGRCSGAPKEANAWHTNAAKKVAMGIDWMIRRELSQAIPPAYAEYIGRAALAWLDAARQAA